jgi:hypothetical protein
MYSETSPGRCTGWHAPRRWRVIVAAFSNEENCYEAIYEMALLISNLLQRLPIVLHEESKLSLLARHLMVGAPGLTPKCERHKVLRKGKVEIGNSGQYLLERAARRTT